jgi:hypothetical protein
MNHIRRLVATAAIGLMIAACSSNPVRSVPSANPARLGRWFRAAFDFGTSYEAGAVK